MYSKEDLFTMLVLGVPMKIVFDFGPSIGHMQPGDIIYFDKVDESGLISLLVKPWGGGMSWPAFRSVGALKDKYIMEPVLDE